MATKILGLIIKVIFTRIVGTKTIGLYSIVMPTYSLLLTICTLAMPTTIATLIAQKKDLKILNSAAIIIILLNTITILVMHITAPLIANNLLKEPNSYYLLIAMSYTLPFASLACILKGYFYGIQKNVPHVISNIVEQLIRLTIVILLLPKLVKISYIHAAVGLILTSVITEFASIIVFILSMRKNDVINLFKVKLNTFYFKDILDLSIPNVTSKIIGNVCYFFEPIILTNLLLYKGYSNDFILTEYGAYNAYAISTLTIPSFFITAIALALIPEISKHLKNKNYYLIKKRLNQAMMLAIILGSVFSIIINIFRNPILSFLYNTTIGAKYIKILAPFFILFYLEAIFSSFMQAINKTKTILVITILASIIKVISLIVLILKDFGSYSLLIAEIINIIITVFLYYKYSKYYLKKFH
ncbi:MAG: oligosaccharide flippase family protein [Bacilli bacterium]|nr:oligosaccharide flippase family protein [Bacilli bacterium]